MLPLIILILFLRPFISEFISLRFDSLFSLILVLMISIYLIVSKKIRKTKYDKLIFFYFLTIIIAGFFSSDLVKSISNIHKYTTSIMIFYLVFLEEERRLFIPFIIVSGFFISIYSLFHLFFVPGMVMDYLNKQGIVYPFAENFLARRRAFVPFVSPNLLAGYIAMVFSIASGFVMERLRRQNKSPVLIFYVLILLTLFFVLFATKSIGAWLSLLASLSCYVLFRKRINGKSLFYIALITVFLLVILYLRFKESSVITFPSFSLHQRINYLLESFKVISAHPFMGVGLGNFMIKETLFCHNSFIQIWAEAGIAGFISWLILVAVFIRESIIGLKIKKDYFFDGLFIAGMCFIFHNFADFSYFIPQVSFIWWMVLGFILAESRLSTNE